MKNSPNSHVLCFLLFCCMILPCLTLKAQTKVYATHSSSGSSGKTTIVVTVQEGKVTNEANAVGTTAGNASLNVYSTSSALYDANAWIELKFVNGVEQLPAGTVYVKYESATVNILNLLLSSSTGIKAYKNATTSTNGTEATASFTSVSISGSNYIKITPTECFNAVRITLVTSSLLLGSAAIDIDGAYYECPGVPTANAPVTICSGSTASLAVNIPVSCVTYSWYSASSGGAALYSGNTVSTAAINGNTTFYIGSSIMGCTSRGSVNVSVNSLPANPSLGNKNICMGNKAQLKVISPNNSLAYKWYVNLSDTSIVGSDTVYMTPNLRSSKSYYVRAQDKTTGCYSADKMMVSAVVPSVSTFGNNADSVTCPVKDNAFVDFIEPSTGRLLASINAHGQDLGNVTTKLYKTNEPVNVQPCGTTSLHDITSVLQRHWKMEPTIQPSAPVDIMLYFSQSEFAALQNSANTNSNSNDDVEGISDLILSKYHSNNPTSSLLNCDGQGATTTFNSNHYGTVSDIISGFSAAGRYVQFSISGFSEMWLHGSANMIPLPIELLSFKADCNGNEVNISWATSVEINNRGFNIQKSIDGNYWSTVGFVPGVGSSNEKLSYIFTDSKPFIETSYYRLEQIDMDGKTATFDAASVECGAGQMVENIKLAVFPNPANDDFSIILNSEDRIDGSAQIFNAIGEVMYSVPLHLPSGGNTVMIKNTLDVGAYFVRVVNANNNLNTTSKLYVSK